MTTTGKNVLEIVDEHAGRRIDNFLLGYFNALPKSRVYRMIRTGEVRVNKGRIKQGYRLCSGDILRLPPLSAATHNILPPPKKLSALIENRIIYEDQHILVVDKPAGVAVHGGSGIRHGVIGALRAARPKAHSLELVHRLDRATSGCLLIAKDHETLRGLHAIIKNGAVKKNYLALMRGRLNAAKRQVDAPLLKQGGKIHIDARGQRAITHFQRLRDYGKASLVRVLLLTGRTHQIRAHAAHIGSPLAGDDKYGSREFNRQMKKKGLRRMFLHAETLSFAMPGNQRQFNIRSELPDELRQFLQRLEEL